MIAREAYAILRNNIPNHEIASCYEYDSIYVFNVYPPDYESRKKQGEPFDSLYAVNKNTGKITTFHPLEMSLKEYKSGKEIKDFI